jgi:hypothetical protein
MTCLHNKKTSVITLCREWFRFLFLAPDVLPEKLDHLYFSHLHTLSKCRRQGRGWFDWSQIWCWESPGGIDYRITWQKKGGRKGLVCRILARKRLILLSSTNLTSRKLRKNQRQTQWRRVPRHSLAMRRRALMENLLLRFWLDLSVWDLD